MNFRTLFSAVVSAAIIATGSAAVAAQQQAAPAPAPAPAAAAPAVTTAAMGAAAEPASSAYLLGRDDTVEIGLLGAGGFGGRVRVQSDGTVQLPLIGKVPAAERTPAELGDQVRRALQSGGFYADPVVTVEVVGYASRYVTVLGQVGAPGLVPLNRPYRLSEIVARVGGVRDGAADHIVVRSEDGTEKKYLVQELSIGNDTQDPLIKAGDKIYAPPAETFYIYGQVNAPGVYSVQNGMSVRMALARAGGLAESGSDKKIDVNRAGKKIKVSVDDKVLPGDVYVVGERLF